MHVPPVMEQEFLSVRAKLLEIGAALDRLDRTETLASREPRVAKIRAAVEVLLSPDDDRAEQIQLVFSRPYEDGWREKFQISNFE
jgi:hypothetical protein